MVIGSFRVCIILLCFVVFICALSGISRGNDSLNGFTLSSEGNKVTEIRNIYQGKLPKKSRQATYAPFLNADPRSTFERPGRTNILGYSNLMSHSEPKLLKFGQRDPLTNFRLSSSSTGDVYHNWAQHPARSDKTPLLRPQNTQAKSYTPLVRPRNYFYRVAPISTRPADRWRWGKYPAVNNFPRTMGYRVAPRYQSYHPWQQRSSVSRSPVTAPLSARYPKYSITSRIIYPADRVERDSVLNMRSGKVVPWGQEEAIERNLHVERPVDQAAVPRQATPGYSNPWVPYKQGGLTAWAGRIGANFAGWKQIPFAPTETNNYDNYSKVFKPELREDYTRSYPAPPGHKSNTPQRRPFTQKPFHLKSDSRKKVSKVFIPRPESSEKLSRLKYVLQFLKKRNARFTTAGASYSKPPQNGNDTLQRTKKSKRLSGCLKCFFNNKRFSNIFAKECRKNRQSLSFKTRHKSKVKKGENVCVNTQDVKKRQDVDSTQINQFEPLSRFRLVNDFEEQSQNTRPPPLIGTVYGTDVNTREPVFVPKVADYSDDQEVKNVLLVQSASPGVKIPPSLPGLKRYLKNHKTKMTF